MRDDEGKWAPGMHGDSKHLKWAVGIGNSVPTKGPASASQTLFTSEKKSPACKHTLPACEENTDS